MKYRSASEGKEIILKDYKKRIIFSLDDFDQTGHLLQIVTIPPNTKQRMHSHNKQTEVYLILEGETIITINSLDYFAKPGDAFITSPGDVHHLWNKTDKDFKLAVFKYNMPKDEDDINWQE